MESPWRIELFGGLRAERNGEVLVRFRTQKTGALLAYLALHRNRHIPREQLIALLWPEDEFEAARHKLNVALSSLRQQLEPPGGEPEGGPRAREVAPRGQPASPGPVLRSERFTVQLNADAVTTDVAEFEVALAGAGAARDAAAEMELLIEAVDLYRGDLLAGYYEDWIPAEQARLEEEFYRAIRRLIGLLEQAGDFERAIHYALQAARNDWLREEAHGELMRLFAAAGRPAAILQGGRDPGISFAGAKNLPAATGGAAVDPRNGRARSRTPVTDVRDPSQVASNLCPGLSSPLPAPGIGASSGRDLEPVGGAVPLDSPFYLVRPTDAEFQEAIGRRDSVVLIKGVHQVGKTSLLARGLQAARIVGARVARSDLQSLNADRLASPAALLLTLAEQLADQLDLPSPGAVEALGGPNVGFQRYLHREVLGKVTEPVVWGLDGVDRLFGCAFGSEIFALFRSWHNQRALDPAGPWGRLTLAIAYATEAHLFITDLNQSPFNVGTRLTLEDFTLKQVAELNRRYGIRGNPPLREEDVGRLHELVGGHPYLVRRGLHELARGAVNLACLTSSTASGRQIFADHLQRTLGPILREPELCDAVQGILAGRSAPPPHAFYRLRSAGVFTGNTIPEARIRCRLYAEYLQEHLL